MFLKGSSSGISISALEVIPSHPKTLTESSYQSAEKEEDDLREQEEDIFDDDEDDMITVSGQDCQSSLLGFFEVLLKILDAERFELQKNLDSKVSDITSVR